MIDNFSLLLTHGLMLVTAWRLLRRPDLDREGSPTPFTRFGQRRGQHSGAPPDA